MSVRPSVTHTAKIVQECFRNMTKGSRCYLGLQIPQMWQVIFNVMADQCLYHSIKVSIHPSALLCEIAKLNLSAQFWEFICLGVLPFLCVYNI